MRTNAPTREKTAPASIGVIDSGTARWFSDVDHTQRALPSCNALKIVNTHVTRATPRGTYNPRNPHRDTRATD
ncbi:MAG: hypothetical protein Tsb0013_04790 [Phycisphaerales bacterium]